VLGSLATCAFNNDDNEVLMAKTEGITAIVTGIKAHHNQADV
jgi:hypothetical protein